jgi:hypothetical protein
MTLPTTRQKPARSNQKSVGHVVLRIELEGVEPLIWRRVRVVPAVTLRRLHEILQIVMGWEDSHLHEFRAGDLVIGMKDVDDAPEDLQDEKAWSLGKLLKTGISEFTYVYDFGDDWDHRVVVEPATRGGAGATSPLCLAGENACPPEDVGGPHGYAMFLQALADPKDQNHEQYTQWIGGVWDPKGFDLNHVNRELRALRSERHR